ncbi:hypothetical protein L218DRAFT_950854 [Marasmius fiardii PR-910]|nr:hypothetical protein L218DRAFT_950854 [Marasmius fiardii PR-910]
MKSTVFFTALLVALTSTVSATPNLESCQGIHGENGFQGNTFHISVDQIDGSVIGGVCGGCSNTMRSAATSQGVLFDSDSCQTNGNTMSAVLQLDKQSWQTQASSIITGLASCLGNGFNQNGVICSCSGGC